MIVSGPQRSERLERARLYFVTEFLPDIVAGALAGGVDMVQLREKGAPDETLVEGVRALRALCDRHGALLILNDRPDLALASGADGVHVGQDDADPGAVRAEVGPDLLIGVSTHSPEQIAAARESEADYLGVGPVYATATKPEAKPVGLELVAHASAHAGKPFFAIGGIDPGRVPAVRAAGAERVAVVRAIRDSADPRAAAEALRTALVEGSPVGAAR
jgi:thiamine-phosphate pyrophosphorylase